MAFFQFLWLSDTLMLVITVANFLWYLFRGPLLPATTGGWVVLLGLLTAIMLCAGWFQVSGHTVPALLLLGIMAAPGFIYVLLIVARRIALLKPGYTAKVIYDDFI